MQDILSAQNPKFKMWKDCLTGKGIREHNLCLIFGKKNVLEFLADHPERVISVIATDKIPAPTKADKTKIFNLSNPLFNELDIFGTKNAFLVAAVPTIPTWKPQKPQGLEMVLPLTDPSNLGACLRSCLGFGATRIILTKESAHPYLPKALRTAAGATSHLTILQGPSINEIPVDAAQWSLNMTGENILDFRWPSNARLVVGPEGAGLPPHLRQGPCLRLPMDKRLESLNAALAVTATLALRLGSSR